MKDINFYMNLDYPYEVSPEEDGGYHAEIPLLPGCIAHGETPEEALQYLNVAKCDWITGEGLYLALKKRGVLIRHFAKPRIAAYNRITIGTREQMQTLIDTIRKIKETKQ